jgi:hypothetical protein
MRRPHASKRADITDAMLFHELPAAKAKPFRLTPPPGQLEKHVVRACKELLLLRGYFPIPLQVGKFRSLDDDERNVWVGRKGLPDYVAMSGHHLSFLVEFKRPGGRLRPAQEKLIFELRQGYGLRVAVVDSVAMLEAFLEDNERAP